MEATVVEILAKFRAEVGDFNQRVGQVEAQLKQLQQTTERAGSGIRGAFADMENAANNMVRGLATASAIGGTALIAFGVKAFNAAAEVQELDTVLQIVGQTTGVGVDKLREYTDAVRNNGIEMSSAQQMVIKFAKNNLDLSKASDIARAAQDLAVISQANSTDTMNRMVHATLSLNSQSLRLAGVQTTVAQAVKKYAKEQNIAVGSMTTAQKQQAVLNAILAEGQKINGVYEASMQNVGKVVRSFPRITKELQVSFGQALIKPLGPLVLRVYDLYKNFSLLFVEGGKLRPILEGLGEALVLLAKPFNNVLDAAIGFVKNMPPMTTSVGELGGMIQKYLPAVVALGAALATFGGRTLLQGVPVLGGLFSSLNPVLIGITTLVALSPQVQTAFFDMIAAMKPLLPLFKSFLQGVVGVVNILITGLAKALDGVTWMFNWLAEATKGSNDALEFMTAVGIAAAIVGVVLLTKKIYGMIAAEALAAAKIILVVGAIALLIYGLVKAWNSSETFRKVVLNLADAWLGFAEFSVWTIGKLVEGLSLLVRASANTLIAWGKFTNNTEKVRFGESVLKNIDKVNGAFDDVVGKINNFRYKFKNMKDDLNKPISLTDIFSGFKDIVPDLAKKIEEIKAKFVPNDENGGGDDPTKKIKNDLRTAIQNYNDFINNEFDKGLMDTSESARGSITKALDLVKKIFDEKGKELKDEAAKKLEDAYWKLDESIRKYIPQAEQLGAAFEAINEEIKKAQSELEDAIRERQAAIDDLSGLLRKPFGEPSEIAKGMSSANATVDSIISMYDRLVSAVNRRFTKIEDGGRKQALLDFLETMTGQLIMLSREREKAIKQWEKANEDLEKLIDEQNNFGKQLTSTVKSYGRALFEVSKANEMGVVQAIKTSTGIVITSVKEASGGLDGLQKQLKDRLATIKSFSSNIRSLISKGLSKDYIRQLLEAGPEAAGAVAELLNTAGGDQISAINSLYNEIGSYADSFSTEMTDKFYGSAVSEAQAKVKGYMDTITKIQAAMDATRAAIEEKLDPLTDYMTQLGKDMADALINELNARKDELIALAQSIAAAVAAALASATATLTGASVASYTPTKTTPNATPNVVPTPKTKNDGSVADWRRGEEASWQMWLTLNQQNYNPTGSLESGTLTALALERAISRAKKALE